VVHAWRQAHRPWVEQRDAQDLEHLELLMHFWLYADSNCIDIGANQGSIMRQMVTIASEGRHLAFEPIPALAARLRTEFPTVDVREVALSDHSGTSEFVHVLDDAGYSGLREQEYPREMRTERIQVQVERLDDCLPEGYQPDFIKIDVEGAERDVLAGALATISRCRPHIVFEHGRAAGNYGARPEEIHDLLAGDAGLEIHDIDGNGPLSRQQMADIVAGGKIWNFVAGPSPRSRVAP
jgi:FkbM family methyltransferase